MPTSRRAAVEVSARVILLALASLLATASSSTNPPPPPQAPTPAQAAPAPEAPAEEELPSAHLYRGLHPVHPDFGTGFCERVEVHGEPYAPFEPELFAQMDGVWIFIGDPGDFEFDGPIYWYANPHPLPDDYGGDWCHYPWPHRHHFSLVGEGYDLVGGFLYFVGAFTDAFFRGMHHKRPFFHRHYRRHYQGGALYRRHRPRYARVGPNRYRRLLPRSGRQAATFRPYRAGRAAQMDGARSRPGRRSLVRRPHRPGLVGRPTREGLGWQRGSRLGRAPSRIWHLGGRRVRPQEGRGGQGFDRRPGSGSAWSRGRPLGRRGHLGRPGGALFGRGGGREARRGSSSRSKATSSGSSRRSGSSGSRGSSGRSSSRGGGGGGGSSRSRR